MTGSWPAGTPGLLGLPSGRSVVGRALRDRRPRVADPDFAVCLGGRPPAPAPWSVRWVRWPDFRLPTDRVDAAAALSEAWQRAAYQRVEICCPGGRGRTGTALAWIAVLDGVRADQAVAYVRRHYHPRAVETWAQRRFVRGLAELRATD